MLNSPAYAYAASTKSCFFFSGHVRFAKSGSLGCMGNTDCFFRISIVEVYTALLRSSLLSFQLSADFASQIKIWKCAGGQVSSQSKSMQVGDAWTIQMRTAPSF